MKKFIVRFFYKGSPSFNDFFEDKLLIEAKDRQNAILSLSGMIQLNDGNIPVNWDSWKIEEFT